MRGPFPLNYNFGEPARGTGFVAVPVNTRFVIGPNASLTGPQALVFMGSVSAVVLGIAALFASRGLWPILPFAGLELAALGAALWVCLRRNRYREVVDIAGQRVQVQVGWVGQGACAVWDLPRGTTRAYVEPGPTPTSPSELVLCSGGQRLVIGRCLTDAERAALCARLKARLSPGWAQPAGDEGSATGAGPARN